MGVRKFFWWLLNKYPKTLSDERREFDNFYIDMSEIIHPCFRAHHDLFRPTCFDELFSRMCRHIDRLFDFVRPRNLLFIAIDGVASRSKMNQIRAGNFTSATCDHIAREIEEKLREQFEKEGKSVLSNEELQSLDPFLYTPGTKFMQLLSEKLQSYICQRMTENSDWGNIKVILSDDKVPGEGEHKIMSFIRAQRASPGYDPNTRHCVYGTDADIIMLALATHEVHFSVLREEVVGADRRNMCRVCYKLFTSLLNNGKFLDICVLREYLSLELEIPGSEKHQYDLERIVDDFIFICFFAGNDYLPRMPPLSTYEGCIDLLMHVYKKDFQSFGGYLVDMQKAEDETGGYINFEGVEKFILAVGAFEDEIFSKRSQIRNLKKNYEKVHHNDATVSPILASNAIVDNVDGVIRNTVELLLKVDDIVGSQSSSLKDDRVTDKMEFGSHGWRERYYKEEFSAETPEEIEATRKTLVAEYGKGLCWVLLFYFSGVPSWSWFYPYRRGPLASDLKGLSQIKVEFQKGCPFKLFDQLIFVLPPSRAHLLPEAYRGLMMDKNSNIADFFYTTESDKDFDGKSCPVQDIECLLSETKKLEKDLKDDEKVRNSESLDMLFVKCSNEASHQALWCSGSRVASNKIKGAVMMRSKIEGVQGVLHVMSEDLTDAGDHNEAEYSRNNYSMFYEMDQDFRHVPQLLEGVNIPQMTVKKEDVKENNLWHEEHVNSNRFQNRRQTSERSGPWRRGGYGGSGSRREASMDLRPFSNNKPWQGGSSSCPSRSDANDWRLNKQSVVASHKNSAQTRHSEGSR